MLTLKFLLPLLLLCSLLDAQSPPAQGLQTEWDVRSDLQNLVAGIQRLKPLVDQVNPHPWVSKGAPASYVGQANAARDELGYLLVTAGELQRHPEKLSVALDTIFRMEHLEAILGSLIQGIRRYQDPVIGDQLAGAMSQNNNNEQKLRQYVLDLARDQEAQSKVMNEEAQRCRGMLLRQPESPVKPAKKAVRK